MLMHIGVCSSIFARSTNLRINPIFAFHFPTGGKTAIAAAFGNELLKHAYSFVVRPLPLSFFFFEEEGGGELINLRYRENLKPLVAKCSGYEDIVFFPKCGMRCTQNIKSMPAIHLSSCAVSVRSGRNYVQDCSLFNFMAAFPSVLWAW